MINIEKLKEIAKNTRRDIVEMAYRAGKNGSHIGGGLSMPEILTTLYFGVMNIDLKNPKKEDRDIFILSKGHGAIALYAVLKQVGYLSEEDLKTFKNDGSCFWTHPSFNLKYGIECSTGSLGQGLAYGAGLAYAFKKKNLKSRVFVYLGDGECDEGSIWEAASFLSHHQVDNLVIVVDENKLQLDDATNKIINKDNLAERWKAFGFDVRKADGHSIEDLLEKFNAPLNSKPVVVMAETIKGKGVSFIENNPEWHMNVLSEEQYKIAISDLEAENV